MVFYGVDWALVNLLNFKLRLTYLTVQESGLHFYKFVLAQDPRSDMVTVTTITKEEMCGLIGNYTRILPYYKKGHDFQTQYTQQPPCLRELGPSTEEIGGPSLMIK